MIRVRRCGSSSFGCDQHYLSSCLQAMLEAADVSGYDLELLLVDEAEQAALNERFLVSFGPTNILSFPDVADNTLGSLSLSLETLRREALLYGQDERIHCVRLLAHGLAHLLGYDHGPEMDEVCAELEEAGMQVE